MPKAYVIENLKMLVNGRLVSTQSESRTLKAFLPSSFPANTGRTWYVSFENCSPGEREFKLPWREAGPPYHHDDKVDSEQ